jgi:hypothetical protein
MNKIDKVKNYANKVFKLWFDEAPTGQSTTLKNYTSGDGDNIGFEETTKKIIQYAITVYGIQNRTKLDGKYFTDETGQYDNQRMDNHIWIDDKVVIVEENRAWIDKPFYTLKRAVVKSFMELPHTKKHLSKNVVFIFSSLAKNVKDITKSTSDKVFGYGDVIKEFNFSGRGRRANKSNYFSHGYKQEELDNYVEIICGVFSEYE